MSSAKSVATLTERRNVVHNASKAQDPQTYAIIGVAMEVHKQLGHGFGEKVYHEAMIIESKLQGLPHEHEVSLVIKYKGAE